MVKFLTIQNPFGRLPGLSSITAYLTTIVTLSAAFFITIVYLAVTHDYTFPTVF